MIRVSRGAEPQDLPALRAESLIAARQRHAAGLHVRRKEDLPDSYRRYAEVLWQAQHLKCAYCENVEQSKRNDVEHFRPAGQARRTEKQASPGYWWLAYTWNNFLFSCRNCNQSGAKLDWFPLEPGSTPLQPEQQPPGNELPTLIDPSIESPLAHIEFTSEVIGVRRRWLPRGITARGQETVRLLDLARPSLVELYGKHVTTLVEPAVRRVRSGQLSEWLLQPGMPFVALSVAAISTLLGVPAAQFINAAQRNGC